MRSTLSTFACLALCAAPLSAQSFNIDFGELVGAPSPSYAGVGLAGYWNPLRGESTNVFLKDLTGVTTGIQFHQVGAAGVVTLSDPSVTGDDAALMNDGVITYNPSLDSCFYFYNLTPGVYELITYAWRPNVPTLMSKSFVDNTPGLELSGGAWPGQHLQGVTYARHLVTVTASGFMGPHSGLAAGANAATGAVCNGMQLRRIDQHETFCFGDGSSVPCPCGNNGAGGNGCANSLFAGGAQLSASGVASVGADGVTLNASSMTGSIAIFFQGATTTSETVIDDGLGCVGGPIIRLGAKPAAGSSSYPQAGDPSVSARGGIPAAGGTFAYQCFYRNAAAAFCPPATSNRTNGVLISWVP